MLLHLTHSFTGCWFRLEVCEAEILYFPPVYAQGLGKVNEGTESAACHEMEKVCVLV